MESARLRRASATSLLTLVLAVLGGLFIYKWSGAWRTVASVQGSAVYRPPAELITTAGLPLVAAVGASTVNYLATVWPAFLFGVLIAGLVRAFVSAEDVARLLGAGVVRQQLIAGAVGMPLMLCSCCIAPIFSSLRAQGAALGTSLALMFSSPSLNVAALFLTFILFPPEIAVARFGMALFAVFALPLVIERTAGENGQALPRREGTVAAEPNTPRSPFQVIGHWVSSSGKIALGTLPWIVLGVFASSIVAHAAPVSAMHPLNQVVMVALVAAFATLMALPTFFEIPLSLLLLQNGFPAAAVAAVLFAGPAINTPSLLSLARSASERVALLVFLGVWITATFGGLSLELWRM